MTAHAMVGDRERFLEAGMDDYVTKPINRDRLQEVLTGIGSGPPAEPPRQPAPPEDGPAADSFDRAELMSRTEGDPELIRMLVSVFREDRANLLGAVDSALETGDAPGLERAAHTLKGAVAVFGAEPARSRAARLETLGREGNLPDARALYPELREWVLRLEKDLQTLAETVPG